MLLFLLIKFKSCTRCSVCTVAQGSRAKNDPMSRCGKAVVRMADGSISMDHK